VGQLIGVSSLSLQRQLTLETKSRGRLLVRRILEYPPSVTHAQIAAEVGLGRETVRTRLGVDQIEVSQPLL